MRRPTAIKPPQSRRISTGMDTDNDGESEGDARWRPPPPSWHDWLMLAIGVLFVIAGFAILPSDPDVGIVTLAMFGSCLAVFVNTIWRKLRYRALRPSHVEVTGGVPIKPRMGWAIGLGLWLAALGVIFVVFGHAYPLLFRVLGGFVAAVGMLLFLGTALGRWPGGYLQFDPETLTIAQKNWRAVIPWDRISGVYEGEYQNNPIVLIDVAGVETLNILPPSAVARAMTAIGQSRAWMGADFAIMTTHYGIDRPVLAAALRRYALDASARAGLRPSLPVMQA